MNDAKEKASNELDSTKQKIDSHTKNIKVLRFKITLFFVLRNKYNFSRKLFKWRYLKTYLPIIKCVWIQF